MDVGLLALGLGGSIGVLGGALALGLRHGIDWDHIAAITDITSTTTANEPDEKWLVEEPGVLLTDESDHVAAELARQRPIAGAASAAVATANVGLRQVARFAVSPSQRRGMFLGTLYAVGHGTMVVALGLTAILAATFLPTWIDPVMERTVGVTLLLLSAYLFYSLYQYLRGGGEFRIRSRWMLVFAGVRNAVNWALVKVGLRHDHEHSHGQDQYGPKTAYSIGLIHGIGAETGTQVLIIATAVGAGTKYMGIMALLFFVIGLVISNSFITVATAAGFVSSQRRQYVYMLAGLLAAVFSLVVGMIFLFAAGGVLPNLGQYLRWIGGPDA